MNATITFRLPYRVEREGDVWVASRDVIDVVSRGDDSEDARRTLAEALQLFSKVASRGARSTMAEGFGAEPASGDGGGR